MTSSVLGDLMLKKYSLTDELMRKYSRHVALLVSILYLICYNHMLKHANHIQAHIN